MRKGRKVESKREFCFTITEFDNETTTIVMKTLGVEMDDLGLATKYMMWVISNHSKLSFDDTMEYLAKGAAAFNGVALTVLPAKGKK
jgi:hypothetical protein